MKGVGRKKTTSEASNDVFVAGEGGDDGDTADADVAVEGEFVVGGEKEDTQMEKGEERVDQNVENSEGDDYEEDEEEEEEDYGDDVVGNGKGPGPVSGDSEMYPFQAIRRKRIRKGQVQYQVKWLGWPETANTWEPPEHLAYVADIIEAFEQSLASGKQRKRRRTNVSHHAQLKKRQERSNTPYSLRRIPITTADNHTQTAPLNDLNLTDPRAFPQPVLFADVLENNGDASNLGKAKVSNGSRSANPPELSKSNEENEYDPKLSELKAATTTGHGAADKLAIQFQEGKVATDSGHVDGRSKGVSVEQVQSDHSRGVKGKKSGFAKKLKEDSHAGEPLNAEKPIGTSPTTFIPARTGIADHVWNKGQKKKMVLVKPICNIIKIIKPLGCSPTVSGEKCVTFMALRSDGTEVMVDNGYLKSHYPQLLIDYYEQRMTYHAC